MRLEHLLSGEAGSRMGIWVCFLSLWTLSSPGGLAQLARASALHAEGQRFDSVILHQEEHNDMMEARMSGDRHLERAREKRTRVEQTSVSSVETHLRRRQTKKPSEIKEKTETCKGAWGMPRLSEAKKDVTSCEKPERGANTR